MHVSLISSLNTRNASITPARYLVGSSRGFRVWGLGAERSGFRLYGLGMRFKPCSGLYGVKDLG